MATIFSPICIGSLEIKNRVMMAPMENGMAELGGEVSDRLIRFFVERARNQVGMIITGSVGVAPEGRGLPTQLAIYDDKYIPGLQRLTEAVHQAGSKIGIQLYHAGRQATEAVTGIQPIAPSPVPCDILGNNPRAMSKEEIAAMVVTFTEAAERAVQAGFDLIELHFAHGYLLHSFLSPHSNKRTDEYGGSLINRMRFPMAVLKAVLDTVGDKAAVTLRISADEYLKDGLKFAEVKKICKEAERIGVQAISLSAGSYDSVAYTIQPMFIPRGFLLPFSKAMKQEVKIPVIVAARLNDAALIESVIEDGQADMVAIGRGLISDEELVVKMSEQRYDDIRYCVACNQGCIDNVFKGLPVTCLVNARAGYEAERNIHPAEKKKRVTVIGAGPAGMEAARVASLRGHDVTIVDRHGEPGGKFGILATPPEKDSFLLYKDYLARQIGKLGVSFVNQEISSVEDLVPFDPDAVIVATGARQFYPEIEGIESAPVVLAEWVLSGKVRVGQTVAIIGGGLVGTETAKFLANQGKKVHLIEVQEAIAKDVGPTFLSHLFAYLEEKGVVIHTNTRIKATLGRNVFLEDEDFEVDHLIIASGYRSNNELVPELLRTFGEVYTVGDARKPRRIIEATEEGFLAGCRV